MLTYWFESVKVVDQDHVTINHRGYRTMHLCQMHLSIVASKLKVSDVWGGVCGDAGRRYKNGF